MILNSVDHFCTLLSILLPNIAHHKPTFQTLKKLVVPQLVKKIPRILCNPNVNSHFHKISSLVPKRSQINRIHAPRPIYVRPFEQLCFQIHLDPPSAVFLSDFRTKILLSHAFHMSRPYRAI